MDFALPPQLTTERKEIQVLRPCQRTKKTVKHEADGDTSCNWPTWNGLQRVRKVSERVGDQKTRITLVYKNVIFFFSFPFIIRNVRLGRERERVEDGLVYTHRDIRYEYSVFLFGLPGSKSSLVYANSRGHTSDLHVARWHASFSHATHAIYAALPMGNNLRPVYPGKQEHFLLGHPHYLCRISTRASAPCLL